MGRKVGQVGVPVVRRDAPGPFRAGLLFRAGLRYASFRTLPVPHLVEHLIMSELPRVPLAHNARVDDEVMVFHASGERSAVLDLIQQVARTVADPPLHRLAHEAKVVGLEEGLAVAPPMAGALLTRYGIHGVGLAGACGPAADQVTEAQVMEFTRRCLTRERRPAGHRGTPRRLVDRAAGGSQAAHAGACCVPHRGSQPAPDGL